MKSGWINFEFIGWSWRLYCFLWPDGAVMPLSDYCLLFLLLPRWLRFQVWVLIERWLAFLFQVQWFCWGRQFNFLLFLFWVDWILFWVFLFLFLIFFAFILFSIPGRRFLLLWLLRVIRFWVTDDWFIARNVLSCRVGRINRKYLKGDFDRKCCWWAIRRCLMAFRLVYRPL